MQTKENINLKDKIFIPLTNDLLFKELLTYPSNRDILIDFLWTFTDLDKSIISKNLSVSYEEPIIKNNLIQLNMLGKVKTDYIKDFSNSFKIINTKDKSELLGSDFIINFYRIDKAEEEIYNKDRKHLWGRYLNAKSNSKREEIAKGDKILMKANDWIEKYIFNDPINEKFHEWHAKIYREEYAKEKMEEGTVIGSQNKAIEMAKKLKEEGVDINTIVKTSGLTKEQVEEL